MGKGKKKGKGGDFKKKRGGVSEKLKRRNQVVAFLSFNVMA